LTFFGEARATVTADHRPRGDINVLAYFPEPKCPAVDAEPGTTTLIDEPRVSSDASDEGRMTAAE